MELLLGLIILGVCLVVFVVGALPLALASKVVPPGIRGLLACSSFPSGWWPAW